VGIPALTPEPAPAWGLQRLQLHLQLGLLDGVGGVVGAVVQLVRVGGQVVELPLPGVEPVQAVRSSVWPRSQGWPGRISWWQRAQVMVPVATRGSQVRRSWSWAAV